MPKRSKPAKTKTKPARAKTPKAKREGYHHGDLRRALLDATLKLVEENGPHGFTLRAAARAAGVTPAASYHHFEDKDALLAGVAEEGFEHFRVALEDAARRPARTAREQSRNVGVAYVLFAVQHPTRFRTMVGFGVQERMRRGELRSKAFAAYRSVRKVLVRGLQSHAGDRIPDAEVLGWWSLVHGLALLAIEGHLGRKLKSAQEVELVVRSVLDALDYRRRGDADSLPPVDIDPPGIDA
jgi:AcrR family transcriptional regulator